MSISVASITPERTEDGATVTCKAHNPLLATHAHMHPGEPYKITAPHNHSIILSVNCKSRLLMFTHLETSYIMLKLELFM